MSLEGLSEEKIQARLVQERAIAGQEALRKGPERYAFHKGDLSDTRRIESRVLSDLRDNDSPLAIWYNENRVSEEPYNKRTEFATFQKTLIAKLLQEIGSAKTIEIFPVPKVLGKKIEKGNVPDFVAINEEGVPLAISLVESKIGDLEMYRPRKTVSYQGEEIEMLEINMNPTIWRSVAWEFQHQFSQNPSEIPNVLSLRTEAPTKTDLGPNFIAASPQELGKNLGKIQLIH